MRPDLTPAADRAIAAASRWMSAADDTRLHAPELLLGLLSETECRAAAMLAAHGVAEHTVRQRWPELRPYPGGATARGGFAADVEASLGVAEELLADLPTPLTLATEHLLLGLVAAAHETAAWLAERGFDADKLAAEIRRLNGQESQAAPVELEFVEAPSRSSVPLGQREGGAAIDRASVLRIVDAAANRAGEGLRVIEDFVRFALDDAHLTGVLKQLRHDLAAAMSDFAPGGLLACRETQADVGTSISTPSEQQRSCMADVLAANFKRVQEALRSLEEYGKVLDPAAGPCFEQLRYRSYTVQRAVEITRTSRRRLAAARLYVLLDGQPTRAAFERLASSLVAAGVDVLQLRDKTLADRELLDRARVLRKVTRGTPTLFIMNDRADLAALAEADGVHVGQEELTVKDARRMVGPEALVGVSTHSLAQARQAVLDGADYLGVGPVFPSPTKTFEKLAGLDLLRETAREITLPAFAIGGITADNLPQVAAAGFTRVAVSAAVVRAADPAAAARQLIEILQA